MTPISAFDYVAHGLLAKAISVRDRCLRQFTGQSPNSPDVLWSDLSGVMFNTSWHAGSFSGIATVLFLGSSIQVVRVYAGWIVTLMKHVQAIWYWAFIELVRKAVGIPDSAINHYMTVSVGMERPSPQPTRFGSGYLHIETSLWANSWPRFRSTRVRTKAPYFGGLSREATATSNASAFNHIAILAHARKPA